MGNLERGVTHFASLLTEDGTKQTLFRRLLGLTLRGDLTYEHVARANFGAHANDAAVVEVSEDLF